MTQQQCGLFTANQNPIPLRGVRVDVRVTGRCSEVTVTQRYENNEKADIEAVYVFPLEEGSAVSGFRAKVGDREIEGRVEERERAFEIYDDAMAEGHGAFLLDQERPNIFTASVGNLRPGTTVEVTVRYVAMLNFEGEALRLMLPTTISPRYVPAGPPQVGEPDGDRINPPLAGEVPYGLQVRVEIDADRIKAVESPSHTVRTTFDAGKAVVTLSSDAVALDRDFVLLVETKDAHQPSSAVAREADGTRVAMVTFYPSEADFGGQKNDVTFIIDCSGSMGGDSIDQARRALALCVRALSDGDVFNIVRFGSSFTTLWPESRAYGQATLDEATAWIGRTEADMGGTEVLAPLKAIVEKPLPAGRMRQLLLLTDGEVSNENDVIALCKTHAKTARVFTFGIGAGASEHLVRGVARASGGAAEFIYPGERIESKVLRMFKRVNTPQFSEIKVDWGGMEIEQAPVEVGGVFAGEAVTVFGRIRSGQATSVTLKADAKTWTVPLDLEHAAQDSPVPKLWARHLIRDLEDGKGLRRGSSQRRGGGSDNSEDRAARRVLELGQRYGLMSSLTSYVAVEVRAESEKSTGEAQLRKVPVLLTKGWGGHGTVMARGLQAAAATTSAMPPRPAMPAPGPMPAGAPIPMGAPGGPPPAFGGAAPPPPSMAPPAPMAAKPVMMDAMEMEYERSAPAEASRSRRERAVSAPAEQRADKAKKSVIGRAASWVGDLFGGAPADAKKESVSRGPAAPAREAEEYAAGADMDDMAFDAPAPAPEPMPVLKAEPMSSRDARSVDAFFDLLLTQRADGSFPASDALRRLLGASWAAVQAAIAQHGEGVVATAVVLAVLNRRFGAQRDEWELAATKAERWLKSQGATFDASGLV